MGRIIKPSEIQIQVNSMISVVEKDREMLQETLIETQAFAQTSELQGAAWTGIKDQVSAHDAVIRGLICMLETLLDAGKRLISESGTEDLNEEELVNQIREIEWNREQYSAAIESYQNGLNNIAYEACLGWYARAQITSYERLVHIENEKIRIAYEKLDDIELIDAATRDLTETVDGLKQTVQQGIEYLSTSWTEKGFASAAGRNLMWITSLNASWKGRALDDSLSADEKIILDKLEEDYRAEKVDKEVYNSIRNGLFSTGIGFLQNAIVQKVSDDGASAIADAINTWVRTNTRRFMDRGLVAVLETGGDYLKRETPTWLTQAVRTGAKYTVPMAGTVMDYCLQRVQGEDVVDAGIKSVSHTAIGIGAAKAGAAIGTAVGGPVGTAVGAVAGFVIGVAGSMVFDWAYDNKENIVDGINEAGKKAKEAIDSAGDAVSGFFSGVSEVFT